MIYESHGTRIVGDDIEKIEPGESVLISMKHPHMRLNDELNFQNDQDLIASAYIIHFKYDFRGTEFLQLVSEEHI